MDYKKKKQQIEEELEKMNQIAQQSQENLTKAQQRGLQLQGKYQQIEELEKEEQEQKNQKKKNLKNEKFS